MKASDLIRQLEHLVEAHGDLDVIITHGADGSCQSCDLPLTCKTEDLGENRLSLDDPNDVTDRVICFQWYA